MRSNYSEGLKNCKSSQFKYKENVGVEGRIHPCGITNSIKKYHLTNQCQVILIVMNTFEGKRFIS